MHEVSSIIWRGGHCRFLDNLLGVEAVGLDDNVGCRSCSQSGLTLTHQRVCISPQCWIMRANTDLREVDIIVIECKETHLEYTQLQIIGVKGAI